MKQTADWLEKLGMSSTPNALLRMGSIYLIDQDLKEIGVLLGHRPKMLRAIGEVAVAAAPSPERAPQRSRNLIVHGQPRRPLSRLQGPPARRLGPFLHRAVLS